MPRFNRSLFRNLKSKLSAPKISDDNAKTQYKKFSYSQCGEDLIVSYIFEVIGITKPTYIDVGAHHPFYLSNTALLYEHGSTGINIEPDPDLFMQFPRYRKKDKNLNIGIGLDPGTASFYTISSPTLNTFSKEQAEGYLNEGDYHITNVTEIPVNSLKNIIDEYYEGTYPHFLNIDAEGVDELIIKSIDFEQVCPLVICIETISFSTSGNGVKNNELISHITSKGYLVYADTNINTIFVREDVWRKGRNVNR